MMYILNNWPLTVVCVAMIVAAVIDGWILKVPNWLTFPLVISGWILGLLNNWDLLVEQGFRGGIGASLAGTAMGFGLLFPVLAIGAMGEGDVKMQMGFGSWIGAFFGLDGGACLWIIWWSFAVAVIIGGILGAIMIVWRGDFQKNMANVREIMSDLTTKTREEAAEAARKRKPRMHLLPYGIPLCMGFIAYLMYAGHMAS
jgi:prepilin peptidase CpaA